MIDERHHNHVVEVPYLPTDKAWSEAIRIMTERFPGQRHAFKAVEKLKDQILKGEPL